MKAEELRIGNWVCNQDGTMKNIPIGEPFKIQTGQDISWGNLYAPIPLTEEWLVKFGFEIKWVQCGWEAKLGDFYLWKGSSWNYWNYATVDDRCENTNEVDVILNFVHQLQNLYYALTGEELTV